MTKYTFCPLCAWIALTPDSRTYCKERLPNPNYRGYETLHCTRVPGHEGDHVACAPVHHLHNMRAWSPEGAPSKATA